MKRQKANSLENITWSELGKENVQATTIISSFKICISAVHVIFILNSILLTLFKLIVVLGIRPQEVFQSHVKFLLLCFTREQEATFRENLPENQKSLGAFYKVPSNVFSSLGVVHIIFFCFESVVFERLSGKVLFQGCFCFFS